MYIYVEFPGNIDSLELYKIVECYKLNVTDVISSVYMYGKITEKILPYLLNVCYKFSYKTITIKNPTK